jgi:hypothetical protein
MKTNTTPDNAPTLPKSTRETMNRGGFAFYADRRGLHLTARNHSGVMAIDSLVGNTLGRVGAISDILSAYGFMKMYTH